MSERIKEYAIIRRATNQEVYRTQINKGSFVRYELMKSHYIQLNFSTARAIYFRLGDYCITEYGIFELTEQYLPTYNNRTGGYDYQLTLNADYWKWNNKTLLFLPLNNRFETSWTLTDTIDKHLALITNNIRYHGYLHNNSFYEVSIQQGVDIESAKMITYDGVHIIEALNNICKEFDCEWWVEGNIIYIGRCEHGSAVDFELDVNVEKMVASEGAGNHATRIYPFGSTQNMPKDYRQGNEGVVVNGIAESRVMLPSNYPTPYVQHPDVATEEEAVEAVVIFEEVYPHTDGTMTTVTSDMKNLDNGNGGTEQARIYRFKDSGLTFKSDYELEQLQIIIQSGTMRGMTFDVIFNPDRKAEMIDDGEGNMVANPEAQVFEIVRNDTYGPMLPNDDINPQKDIQAGRTVKYRLIGWDASKMQEMGLVAAAELELQEKAEAYAEKLQMDSSTYTCTMNSDWAYGLDEHGQADSTNSHRYDIGQKVRLVNGNFFKDGSRVSRIVGFELKLDFEYDHPQYFVGEAPDYSRFGDIESKIDAITFKSTNYMAATNMGSGGASVYVIGTGDVTPPTDGNVFSARRSLQQFVRRDKDDTISGLHIYQRSTSAERGIQSSDFNPGVFGTGFTVKRKPSGRTVMETDELIVRIKAFFANLEIRELSYVGGNYLFSCAGSKLLRVEWYDENDELLEQTPANQFLVSYFRCYFYQDNGTTATMNYWMVGDQARCQKFNIKPGVYQNITNKYYWRLVVGKGDDYVDLSATDCDFDSDIPEAEDSIVQLGFRGENNSRRQGCIFLDVESENSPAIYEYSGITSYQLPEPTLQLSPKKNIIYGEFHSISDGSGGNVDTRTLQEQILALLAEINAIKNQADKKFEIWFGHGVPTANNYPAEDWTTDELKALHEQDIYYDVDRSPGSRGGRAYRWVAVHTGEEPNIVTTYQWMEITDQDTIDALEKIADVASDEMLTGGAEKTRVLVDWCKAEHEYWKYTEQARDYGLNDANYYAQGETNVYNAYVTAFLALGRYLNGDTDLTLASAGVYNTPSWLAGANLQADTPIESPAQYRLVWNNYYLTLATLLKAITKRAKELADAAQADATAALNNLEKIASDGWLMPDEKIEVRREFVAAYQEMNDEGGILDKAMDDRGSYNYINYNTHIKPYKDAFNALGTYLNGGNTWTSPAIDPDDVTETAWILPEWIDDDHMGTGVQINGDTFCSLWATFYSARTVVLTELSKNAQTTATEAHERVDDIVSDGVISAGSEKSLLYIDWLKTVAEYWKYMEQAGDYTDPVGTENRYVVNTTAFTTAFTELATMLNNGVTATERILAGTDRPSWLDADHINADTVLANTPILTADAYRTKWKNYSTALTALLEVITKRAKELADAAQADATAALSKISDMANDGKLVPDEKLTVKREFLAAWHERDDEGGILDKCKTPSAANPNVQVYINDTIEAAYVTPYLNAFKAVGSYLNGRSNNSPVTWNGITITSSTTDAQIEAAMPAWLKEAAMSTTNDIDGDDWRNVWATFYSARTALLTALSEDAKDRADDALEKIGDIVDDGIISGGSEKNLLYIQWMKAAYEYVRYVEQAHDYGVSVTAFETAYTNLVKMLNGNTNPTDNMLQGITPPLWLNSEANNANNISHDTTLSDFGLTAVTYRDKWNAYHSALAAMLEAIDLEAKQRADDAQSDATEALEAIDGIAADGTLSVTEIPDLRREFEAAYRQRAEMVDLATSDSTYKLIDATLRSPLDDYLSKFKLLANYLNRGTAWTEPSGGTYSVNNGQNVADANATYNVVAKSLLVVADFPSLLKIEADVKFVADWSANPLVEDNGAAFRNLWASLTTAQVALANAMATLAKNNADNAQQTADDAQDEIDQITADSVLSRIEKKQVRKEFEAIIRNKQYNLILATQFDVANSDYGTDSNGNSIVTQYTTAYNNLGKYLNGDFESGSSSSWTADTVPAWLADLTSDQDIVPATYRSYWVNYYDKENALLNAISSIAKKAGDDALAKLQDIASDGKITPSEKNTILISWREIISELPIICGQADTFYTQTENSDLTLYKGDYLAAFGTLAQILNDGDTYSYNISTGNFPTPKWLSQYLTRTETLTSQAKDDFNEAWDNYYAERTYLQDLLLEVAKKPGDDALGELDNLAADNILTEFEKLTTLREWDAARTEHTDLVTKAQYAHVSYSAYENAYYKLGNYLVDLTTNGTSNRQGNTVHNKTIDGETYNFSVDYAYPLMLFYISGNTNISGSIFKEYWSAYYNERSKLLSAIANHHINIFTGDSNPTPPYSVGDYWIKSDNSEWVCIYPRGIGESYNSSDWRDMRDITEKRDPRVVLAGFGEKIYPLISSYISGSYVTAFWNSSTPQNYNNGDIWYNGSTVYQRISGSWVENTSVIVKGAFVAVDGVLDVMNRTSIRLYGTRQNISPSKYDLFLHTITYTDPYLDNNNQYKTLESGVEILMYNGDNDWETLRESVRSVIDKLNDYIRMIVFGTTNGNLTASGAVVKSDFVSMFATAVDTNGHTITEAYLSAYVTKGTDGILESGVKIRANKIEFVAEDGVSAIKIAANNIDFVGKTVINNKFTVDANGNVTMDGFTATNATITGSITATSGKIGGFAISGNGLTNENANGTFTNDAYIILRNDTHRCFVGIGPNVLPSYSTARALARYEIEDNDDWFGGGSNIALVLRAKNNTRNFAFLGEGNGVLNGWIGGYRFTKISLTTANTLYGEGYMKLRDNNTFLVYSSVSNSGIALPRLTEVRSALSVNSSTNFCVLLTIVADLNSTSFVVRGRCKIKNSQDEEPWNTTELPLITHWDGSNWNEFEMAKGDSATFLLIYDTSKSLTIDGFSCYYTARLINQQN